MVRQQLILSETLVRQAEPAAVRQIPEEEQLYRGVQAPQRKAVADEPEVVTEIPKVRRSRCSVY